MKDTVPQMYVHFVCIAHTFNDKYFYLYMLCTVMYCYKYTLMTPHTEDHKNTYYCGYTQEA